MSSLFWMQTVRYSDGIPVQVFFKKLILTKKKSAHDSKSMKNYAACKELNVVLFYAFVSCVVFKWL